MNAATPHKRIKVKLRQWRLRGQGLVEYALIFVMVAIVIIGILTFIGQVVFVNLYSKVSSGFGGAQGG